MKNKLKIIITIGFITFFALGVLAGSIFENNSKKENTEKIRIQGENLNNNNRKIALLSKPLGSDVFSGITSTPTSGVWTITSDCRGMTIAWDNEDYTLNAQVTQTPASCRVSFTQLKTLADAIKMDNPEYTTQVVTNDDMFQSRATTNQGLWTENRAGKTEGNLPTYFFRGDIDNNYVSFANKMWRIVRINEDGSVKLILGGNSATDGYGGTTTFNPNSNAAEYLDYSRADNALKVANQDWYTNDTKGNLDAYESYIADTKFCNDKSVAATPSNEIYYGAFSRITGYSLDGNYTSNARPKAPQYKCPSATDNYVYKIGALTADEVSYAGGIHNSGNGAYYLYDNVKTSGSAGYWWLISSFSYNTTAFVEYAVCGTGDLCSLYPNTSINFRPVISLKSDTLIIRGDGTFENPYVITE